MLVPNFGLWGTGSSTLRLDHIEILRRDDITDPLHAWRKIHFGSTADNGNGANTFDFDQDGLANLIEYAFALDPKRSSAGLLPQPFSAGETFSYQFTPPAGVSGITYASEWSGDLSVWQSIPNTGTAPQYTFSFPGTGETKLFFRLKVTEP